tara:strand:+ start:224 stop:496 length:273 start_codon:yes stop_codon:yes gene_type:complete
MVKLWFLIALMSYPNIPAIHYKGFGGFLSQEKCEEKRIVTKNKIKDIEIKLGRIAYIETYCLEVEAFESQLKKKEKLEKKNKTNNSGLRT